MVDTSKISIEKLNRTNYQIWKYKMELLLIKDGIWDVIEDEAPPNPTTAWKRKHNKARASIGLLVDDGQFNHIKKATTALESWTILKKRHENPTLSNKVSLLKRICNLKMEETGDMEEHVNEMNDLVDQLKNLGEELKETLVVAMMLRSLPDSYDALINVLENKPEADMTVEFIVGKLVDEHKKRMESKPPIDRTEENSILKISNGARTYQSNCHYCGKAGHMRANCFAYKKHVVDANTKGSADVTESANAIVAHEDDDYEFLF